VLLLFMLPLVSFYISRAFRPEFTSLYLPQAQATVARAGGSEAGSPAYGLRTRIACYIHDFYQNGL
jgi:hypothetical protein